MAKFIVLGFLILSAQLFSATPWTGNFRADYSRDANEPECSYATELPSNQVGFNHGVRIRATKTNLCFEVYQEGITEYFRGDLPQYLHVEVVPLDNRLYHAVNPETGSKVVPAEYVAHWGNNGVYKINLRWFDPYWYYYYNGTGTEEALPNFDILDNFQILVNGVPAGTFSVRFN